MTKPAKGGGSQDGAELPVVPECMLAYDTSTLDMLEIYEDVGLWYIYRGIQNGRTAAEEDETLIS